MISMSKTYTPELTPEVLDRLRDYADVFRDDFSHKKQAAWSGVYLQGLLHDGERKSIEPLSGRVTLPPGLDAKDPEQALQQFVNQSPWDDQDLARRYRRHLAADLRQPRRDLRLRRHQLPQAGDAFRRRPAAVLRGPGQEGQLPGRPLGPLRQPRGPLPVGDAAVPARLLDRGPGAAGRGGRPGGLPASPDQGRDRPGVAGHGARRRAAGVARRGGCRLRGVGGLPRGVGRRGG